MNIIVVPLFFLWTIGTIAVFPAVFGVLKIFTFRGNYRIMRTLIWLYGRGWFLLLWPFARFKRERFKANSIKGPCIFVVNHRSFFDTYCMALLTVSDICFAVRSWPFKIFFYRPFMHIARYLDVESLGWEKTVETARDILSKGSFVLFFPEGHRSRDGRLKRFYSGAFKLSIETRVPVVPLCMTGTEVLFPPGRWWFAPARIKLRVLPGVYPDAFTHHVNPHTEMRKHVKELMVENLKDMKNEKILFSN